MYFSHTYPDVNKVNITEYDENCRTSVLEAAYNGFLFS